MSGTAHRNRTCNLYLRRVALYPIELEPHDDLSSISQVHLHEAARQLHGSFARLNFPANVPPQEAR